MTAQAPRFRGANAGDLPALVRMLANDPLGARREQYEMPLPDAYVRAFEAIDRDPFNELVVAVDEDDAPIAMLQLTLTPYLTHRGGWRASIEGVRVDERYRDAGLGRRLLEHAIDKARARGCHVVQLTSDKQRPDAIRFYERMGFKATHEGMKLGLSLPPPPARE